MTKIDNKKLLNIITVCIVVGVPFLKFLSMNLEMFGILENYDSINPAFIIYLSVPILIGIYIVDIIKSNRSLNKFDYVFIILIIVSNLSTMFSINPEWALLGKPGRHEGLLSILCYYLLFINHMQNKDKENINKFINLFIGLGIVNSIYAFFQIYTDSIFVLRYSNEEYMASGMCGNPNFFGSLMAMCLGMVTYQVLINKKITFKQIIVSIILFISLINSQSTGPFLALIITFLFGIVFFIVKKELVVKNLIIIISVLLSTYISIYLINTNIRKSEKCELCSQGVEETINSGGNGRLEIWKNSIDIVKNNFIVGVGFDNFALAYPNLDMDNGTLFSITGSKVERNSTVYFIVDNAHNVYLHTLVSTGILGFIPYIVLLVLTFLRCIKSKNKLLFVLFGGFFAYSIQAVTNISVIQVAPIYYIIIGLILSIEE